MSDKTDRDLLIKILKKEAELIKWLGEKIIDHKCEAAYSGMFSSGYWDGKVKAFEQVRTKLIEEKP